MIKNGSLNTYLLPLVKLFLAPGNQGTFHLNLKCDTHYGYQQPVSRTSSIMLSIGDLVMNKVSLASHTGMCHTGTLFNASKNHWGSIWCQFDILYIAHSTEALKKTFKVWRSSHLQYWNSSIVFISMKAFNLCGILNWWSSFLKGMRKIQISSGHTYNWLHQ